MLLEVLELKLQMNRTGGVVLEEGETRGAGVPHSSLFKKRSRKKKGETHEMHNSIQYSEFSCFLASSRVPLPFPIHATLIGQTMPFFVSDGARETGQI